MTINKVQAILPLLFAEDSVVRYERLRTRMMQHAQMPGLEGGGHFDAPWHASLDTQLARRQCSPGVGLSFQGRFEAVAIRPSECGCFVAEQHDF